MFSHPVRSGEKIFGDDEIKDQSRCREKAEGGSPLLKPYRAPGLS